MSLANKEKIKRLLHQAEQCLILGRNTEAEILSRETVKLDPKNPEAYYFLGEALCKQRRFKESIKSLEKVNKLLPKHPRIIHLLGWVIFMHGDAHVGRTYLKQALSVLPEDVQILCDLAVLENSQGKGEAAKEYILKALRIQPNNPLAQEVFQQVLVFDKSRNRLNKKLTN